MHQHRKTQSHIDGSMFASRDDIAEYRRARAADTVTPAEEIKKQRETREEARIEFCNTVERIVTFISSGSGIARHQLPSVFQNMGGRLLAMNDEAFKKHRARMREEATRIGAIELYPDKHSSDRLIEQHNQKEWEDLLDQLYDGYRNYKRCAAKGQTRS